MSKVKVRDSLTESVTRKPIELLWTAKNDDCPISGLSVSVVSLRQVLWIQCHCTEPRRMEGGQTSSFTFQAKFLGSISKGVNLSLCICAHLFMSLCSMKENLKPCWFSQLVFLHSDGRKKDDILLYHFHRNLVRRHQGVYVDLPVGIST